VNHQQVDDFYMKKQHFLQKGIPAIYLAYRLLEIVLPQLLAPTGRENPVDVLFMVKSYAVSSCGDMAISMFN